MQHLRPALVMIVLFTLVTGLAYPFAMTGIAQVIFPAQANGSLITKNGVVVGSSLIGQVFTSDKYFHPRPSATTNATDTNKSEPYNAANSGASNYGATSQKLIDRVKADIEALRGAGITGAIPADAVTTSASGLDPHISPDYAILQVPRVAKARDLPVERVRALVDESIQGRFLGLFGEPRVNVLLLNLKLDEVAPPK